MLLLTLPYRDHDGVIVTSHVAAAFAGNPPSWSDRRINVCRPNERSVFSCFVRDPTAAADEPPVIPVLFEDERVLAVRKPEGVAHHDDDDDDALGVLNLLRSQRPVGSARLYGVHRLDRVTSGILLFAKDAAMAGRLTGAFRDHKVVKYYAALSAKKPRKQKQGWVRGDMVPSRRGAYKLSSHRSSTDHHGNHNNYAVTRFFTAGLGLVHDAYGSNARSTPSSLSPRTAVLFRPSTGKTHQLRVAAKSVGLPILGDARYGAGADDDDDDSGRTYLHAVALHVDLADEGLALTIVSKPPFFESVWGRRDDNGSGDNADHDHNARIEYDRVFDTLMAKHCDCQPILDKWNEDTY